MMVHVIVFRGPFDCSPKQVAVVRARTTAEAERLLWDSLDAHMKRRNVTDINDVRFEDVTFQTHSFTNMDVININSSKVLFQVRQ